ncbi:hypothetical protein [Shewanella surugensis]|uniref:Uncharacterized protein n=1 Tax=Shewanella surugensis TaxID=212020 RepID=A0ABT0LK22_9GAMM|nr:hypothetical protein [Shewanella surugensis]MCL1128059.1 hypothetical protein [Shewanella surugensis]
MTITLISVRKIVRYGRQVANGKHQDDLTNFLGLLDTRAGFMTISLIRKLPKIGKKYNNSNTLNDDSDKENYFSQFNSINDIRNDLLANENMDISYISHLDAACSNVNLPMICTNASTNSLFDRFDFQDANLSIEEKTQNKARFYALAKHSFGNAYNQVSTLFTSDEVTTNLNNAMYQSDPLNDGIDRRLPYIVSSDSLGAFITDGNDGIILLNDKYFTMPQMEQEDKDLDLSNKRHTFTC